MKVVEQKVRAPKTTVTASNIPVGRFAKVYEPSASLEEVLVYLRVPTGLVRFINGKSPIFFSLTTYEVSTFEVLPESYTLILGGE